VSQGGTCRPGGDRTAARDGSVEQASARPTSRILERPDAVRLYGPGRDFRLVFTNGCFDLLHRGHVACLTAAAGLGDRLVVGLNSDASVRRLKGRGRPVLPVEDRAYLLASLRAVDAVTVFEEETPLALIASLVPDVLVKGGDYGPEEVVGREVVEEAGGRVHILPLEEGRSTSDLIRRIRAGSPVPDDRPSNDRGPQARG